MSSKLQCSFIAALSETTIKMTTAVVTTSDQCLKPVGQPELDVKRFMYTCHKQYNTSGNMHIMTDNPCYNSNISSPVWSTFSRNRLDRDHALRFLAKMNKSPV